MDANPEQVWPQVFHVGVPRSGSQTLRAVLRGDRRVNLLQSRYFNTPLWYSGRPGFVCDPARVNVLSLETLVRQFESRFSFIVSLEHVRQAAPQAHIVLTVREQRAWLLSRYRWGIGQGGISARFSDWLCSPNGCDFVSIGHYATLLRCILALYPRERVHVLLFEDLRDDYAGFFRRLYGILGVDAPALKPMVTNASPPDGVLAWRRRLNRARLFGGTSPLARLEGRLHARLSQMAAGTALRSGAPAFAWGEGEWFRNLERDFAASNRELASRTGLDLGARGYLV